LTLVLASCALPLTALPARGQQRAVTLAEALTLAQQASPDVVQARGNVRSAGAGVRAAWGSFLPSLSTSASYGGSFSDGPSRTDPITGEIISGSSSSRSLSLGGTASVDLFTGFSRGSNLTANRANRSDADAALVVQQSQTALSTTNLFLLALQDADLVRVRNDAIRRAQEKLAIANAKLVTRATTIADSLQAVVDLTRFQLQLLTDQRNLADAEANLARQVGMDGRVAAVSDSSLFGLAVIADTAALMSEAQERSPAVIRAVAQVRAAKANVSIVRATYLPRISLSAGTTFSGSNTGGFELFNGRSASLGLSWPLFNGFQRELNLVTRQAALETAISREADARRQVGSTLTSQLAALSAAEQRAALTAQNLETARASARVQTERYRLGSIGIVELNAAQDALSNAETDAVSARYDYLRAKAQIEAILGRTL
jgi:outer membrane protein TolC